MNIQEFPDFELFDHTGYFFVGGWLIEHTSSTA